MYCIVEFILGMGLGAMRACQIFCIRPNRCFGMSLPRNVSNFILFLMASASFRITEERIN